MYDISRSVVLIGFIGSGKSTVGLRCSKNLGLVFSDMDYVCKKAVEDKNIQATDYSGLSEFKEDFQKLQHKYLKVFLPKKYIISTSCDCVSSSDIQKTLEKSFCVWIDCSLENCIQRCKKREENIKKQKKSYEDKPVFDITKIKDIEEMYVQRKDIYSHIADVRIDNNLDLDKSVNQLTDILKNQNILFEK